MRDDQEDRQEPEKARLELSEAAPNSTETLLIRLAIRDADIDGSRAQKTLQAVGRNCSPMRASTAISDVKRVLRILERAELLHPDFERLRRRCFDDFIEIQPRKKRRRA